MKPEILKWIDEYQKGKSGIIPYKVAMLTAMEFKIDINESLEHVRKHITDVLKYEMSKHCVNMVRG